MKLSKTWEKERDDEKGRAFNARGIHRGEKMLRRRERRSPGKHRKEGVLNNIGAKKYKTKV